MLTRIIETSSLGFDIKVKAVSNTAELRTYLDEEGIANLVNSYVLAHVFLSKARKVICNVVANFTGVSRLTKAKGEKLIPAETEDVYVKRATAGMSVEDKNDLNKAIQAALEEKELGALNYVVASRSAGSSLTKGLAAYIKKAVAAWETYPGKFKSTYIAKGMGSDEDFDEETTEGENPEFIVNFAKYLKAAAEAAARKAEAEMFGEDV